MFLLIFVGFSWVGGCLGGPGAALWVVLAARLLVGVYPQGILVVSGGAWAAEQLPGGTPDPDYLPNVVACSTPDPEKMPRGR